MYQAIAIKQQKITSDDVRDWWIVLSKPCSLSSAEKFEKRILEGETFAVKTVYEVNNYKNILR